MKKSDIIKDLIYILMGCVCFALGVAVFYQPASLAPGGASGIAIIVNGLTDFPTGTTILLVNIPLFIIGFFGIGKNFLFKSIYATVLSSVMIDVFTYLYSKFDLITSDKFICAVFGGVFCAIGMGIVFKYGGSTGGTDIVAKLIRRKRRDVPTGKIFLLLDSAIIACSAFASRDIENALYAAVALFIATSGLDLVLYGKDEAKFLVIISSYPEQIAEKLLKEVDVGVTYANGAGAYTGNDKKIILCAVKKQSYPQIKDMVNEIDPSSFMIVSSASEIYGEGYKFHGAEEL